MFWRIFLTNFIKENCWGGFFWGEFFRGELFFDKNFFQCDFFLRGEFFWPIFFDIFFSFHSEVLEPHVLPFIQGHPARDRIVFQQDGARCHNARITTQWLEANINARMICSLQSQQDQRIGRQPFLFEWPPYSPDMSPMDFGKVHIFWEGHKILRNLHLTFDWHYTGQK